MQRSFADHAAATLGALLLFALSALLLMAGMLASTGGWPVSAPAIGEGPMADQVDSDVAPLALRADQAAGRVREVAPDAVLRQIDLFPPDGGTFRFVGAAGTQELDVTEPASTVLPDQWTIGAPHISPLTNDGTRPGIDFAALRIGPGAVVRAIAERWPDCLPRSLTLARERGPLTWYGACILPDGRDPRVTVDGRAGESLGTRPGLGPAVTPSVAPPAH